MLAVPPSSRYRAGLGHADRRGVVLERLDLLRRDQAVLVAVDDGEGVVGQQVVQGLGPLDRGDRVADVEPRVLAVVDAADELRDDGRGGRRVGQIGLVGDRHGRPLEDGVDAVRVVVARQVGDLVRAEVERVHADGRRQVGVGRRARPLGQVRPVGEGRGDQGERAGDLRRGERRAALGEVVVRAAVAGERLLEGRHVDLGGGVIGRAIAVRRDRELVLEDEHVVRRDRPGGAEQVGAGAGRRRCWPRRPATGASGLGIDAR